MTPHIEAKPGDYAEAVLLPGDPLRAKWLAETFLTGARQVNGIRNALGYTGTFRGKPVSVQATGMGQPSVGIYVHELATVYGAKTLIRVGTCGGLSPRVKLRDLIIAATASTDSAMGRDVFTPWQFSPTADYRLLRAAADLAEARRLPFHVGGIASGDAFYPPQGNRVYQPLIDHDVLGIEMEAYTIYTLAARHKVRALAVCAVSDLLATGEHMPPADRQSSLKDLAELALTVATEA